MPTLAVQLAGGQEVVSDFFLDADSKIGDLADAAGCQLAVASSRCVLLSPSGDCMAHSHDCFGHQSRRRRRRHRLVDGPSTGIRAPKRQGLRCSEKRRLRRHMGGGDSDDVRDQLTDGVRHVVGTWYAFAAVKQDGSVVTGEMQVVAATPTASGIS